MSIIKEEVKYSTPLNSESVNLCKRFQCVKHTQSPTDFVDGLRSQKQEFRTYFTYSYTRTTEVPKPQIETYEFLRQYLYTYILRETVKK